VRRIAALASITVVGVAIVAIPPATATPSSPSAFGDFNDDGFHDLAVGVPREAVNVGGTNYLGAGIVQVIYGGSGGLSGTSPRDDQVWYQGLPGVAGRLEFGDDFGSALAWGDLNGDGIDDLAIGAPGEDLEGKTETIYNAGAVTVLFGSASGLTATGSRFIRASDLGAVPNDEDAFGFSLAVGQLGRGAALDLAIGAPERYVGTNASAGEVFVLYGAAGGPSIKDAQRWSQGLTGPEGLADLAEPSDRFGWELEIARVSNAVGALVIGVIHEDVGTIGNAGAINVVYATSTGLSATGNRFISLATQGVPGDPTSKGNFGESLTSADFGLTAHADVAVGAPALGTDSIGSVTVLYGAAAALSTEGAQRFHRGMFGVVGPTPTRDGFGYSLAAADFGRSAQADLAIGVPFEKLASVDGEMHGKVIVAYGTANGLSNQGGQHWSQLGDVEGTPESFDLFGFAVAAANWGRTPQADLAIGVPEETIPVTGPDPDEAGFLNVLYGTSTGLSSTGDQGWFQGAGGLKETLESGDHFGTVLA